MASNPTPPAAPDPVATANAQSAANKQTAITQSELNQVNQVTPQGNLTYNQSGTTADGTPQFTATQTYSPQEQQLFDLSNQTQQNLGNIGVQQSSKIGDLLNTPFNTDTATADKIQGLQNEFLNPQWDRQQTALQTQLIDKGVRPGTVAYTNAMNDFSNQRQKGYDQSYLDSYNTGQQAALTQRNQPINEISALLSGSQVSQPSYTNTPNAGVAPTDVIGAQQQSLNQQNLGYQAQLNQNSGLMSGLFGLGSSGLFGLTNGLKFSDIRLKDNVRRIGYADNGLPIYSYKYKGENTHELGFMAHEVQTIMPEAVKSIDGYLAVNYGMIYAR